MFVPSQKAGQLLLLSWPVAQPLLPLHAMQMEAAACWFLCSAQPCHVVDGWHKEAAACLPLYPIS